MNIKLAAVNALKFVRKFGMTCQASGTSGLVLLADGTVEQQTISYSRRGKVVTSRRVVGKAELKQWQLIAYIDDGYEPVPQPVMEPVRGRNHYSVILDDGNFRLEH